jgi:two-component system, NarL family, nitrate/nitrite response regulator NarL
MHRPVGVFRPGVVTTQAMRLLIVEDDVWVRRSLADLLRTTPDLDVITTGTGREALELAASAPPDVALVDIGLPDITGITVITELRRSVSSCVPVAFTVFDDAPTVLGALRAGARGYILKSTPSERILPLLHEAFSGGLPLSPSVASLVVETMLATSPSEQALSERESELLALLARGATYAQCASTLGIGVGTVQSYVKNIYAKLEVSSKAEAAVAAVRLGLVK